MNKKSKDIQEDWHRAIPPKADLWFSHSTSSQHQCLTTGEAASCLIRDSCFVDSKIAFECVDPLDNSCASLPAVYSFSRHTNEFVPSLSKYEINFLPLNSSESNLMHQNVKRMTDRVLVLLSPYYTQNIGHIIGDDIFAIFLALSSFHLQMHKVTVVLHINDSPLTQRVRELFSSVDFEVITLADTSGLCAKRVVAGISGLTFTRPVLQGNGLLLDNFNQWLLSRANLQEDTRIKKGKKNKLKVLVLQKDFSSSHHPMGMQNGAEVAAMIAGEYSSSLEVVVLNQVSKKQTYTESIKEFANTDILISSPGSDLMNGIYLRPGACMVVICYCKFLRSDGHCDSTLALEVAQWYRVRGSVHISPYCNITKEELVDTGKNPWAGWEGQPWHQVVVQKEKLLPLVKDCMRFIKDRN